MTEEQIQAKKLEFGRCEFSTDVFWQTPTRSGEGRVPCNLWKGHIGFHQHILGVSSESTRYHTRDVNIFRAKLKKILPSLWGEKENV